MKALPEASRCRPYGLHKQAKNPTSQIRKAVVHSNPPPAPLCLQAPEAGQAAILGLLTLGVAALEVLLEVLELRVWAKGLKFLMGASRLVEG